MAKKGSRVLIGFICEANEDIDYFPLKVGNRWKYYWENVLVFGFLSNN